MKTMTMTVPVNPDRTITVQLPPDVAPDAKEVEVVVVVGEAQVAPRKLEPLNITPYDVGIVDPTFSYRREDLYGDGDR